MGASKLQLQPHKIDFSIKKCYNNPIIFETDLKNMDIAKFLHLFCGVTLTGANLAGYLYVSLSAKSNQPKLFKYSLKFSFLMDIIACLMIFVQFASGTDLVASHHYAYLLRKYAY